MVATGWIDADSGHPVNVYAPGEPMARERPQGSVGGLIRAMVTGRRGTDAEIMALGESTGSTGGFLVPEEFSNALIDLMRSKTCVIKAGAKTINMSAEKLHIAAIATDPTVAWRLENDLIAESAPTFSRLTFLARWLGCLVKTSRELIEDSANSSDAIQQALAGALSVEWDRIALVGSGTAPQPRGISNTVGIHAISLSLIHISEPTRRTPISYAV